MYFDGWSMISKYHVWGREHMLKTSGWLSEIWSLNWNPGIYIVEVAVWISISCKTVVFVWERNATLQNPWKWKYVKSIVC